MPSTSYKVLSLLALLIVTLACLPTLGSTAPPIPTLDSNAPLTAIVETFSAASTLTATNAPPTATSTATPTRTPTASPTSTPTFLFIVVTNTQPPTLIPIGSSGKDYECQVLAVQPKDFVTASTAFTAKWTVVNVGKATWDSNNSDYSYADGQRMYLQSIYDLPVNTAPGVTIELTADMQAPASPGTYTTTWGINIGKRTFCKMELTITVP